MSLEKVIVSCGDPFKQVFNRFLAAFDYNYNAFDDGERSEISKGYENIL